MKEKRGDLGPVRFQPRCQTDPRSDALKRGFEQGCRAAAGAQAKRRKGKKKRGGWPLQGMCGMRGARPNHCTRAGAPAAPRVAQPRPRPRAREGACGGRLARGAAGAAPSRRAGRRGWAWARRGAVRGRLPAPGRRALRAVVEATVGGDAAALLLRCRRESLRRRQLRARTPVHGTQGGGRPSCPGLSRRRRAALLGESRGRGRRRSPLPAAAPAGRRRAAKGSSQSGRGPGRPPPCALPLAARLPRARARRDDLPQQQRQPRGQQQLQDALPQAGEAAAGMPSGGRRPRFKKDSGAGPDTAPRLGGTRQGGDLVSEGSGPRGRLRPVTLGGEMPSPRRPGRRKVEEGEGAERRRELERAGPGASPGSATSLGFFLKPLCVEEYDNKS